ncbi:substrate-binding periplasmic protein [Colwellia hornerae]|uniref:Amino acid ABC transporter substrate-binding protein n=1 Tax=Colwellia hornerae TaxID=89402 RepID=A0A5C6QJD2_9GAMM|nr:transporter substrate-binding domain-containing protein [Colwellia hornerae]TWX53362.1 amino acid ABC transporter substrate-binding protein [Colwellia hornerae]TWX60182.1 amino acid ABC transporter substrate-binding protein [Colwellia hornerae]TWX69025.1 amino acid ABC transporter substrate-binding protein [Colwellia hornerae]
MVKNLFWPFLFIFLHFSSSANECKVINAACSSTWYPVSFLLSENQNRASGVAVEIVRAANKKLNVDIIFNCQLPWKRAISYLDSGKIDMLVGHYLNPKREQNWQVSDGLFVDDIRAVYLDKRLEVEKISDLKGLVGVKPSGASYGAVIDEYTSGEISGYKIGELKNNSAMIGQLLAGRVDYVLSEKRNIQGYAEMLGLVDVIKLSDSLSLNSVHFSFAKTSPCAKYSDKFNILIKHYQASGLVNTLFEQARDDFRKRESFLFIKNDYKALFNNK